MSKGRVALLGAITAVILTFSAFVGGALAGGSSFSDVQPGHPFYDEIEWMAANDISNGFNDGTYRPGEPVTRQAMSAFMARLAGSFHLEVTTSNPGSGTEFTKTTLCPDGEVALAGGGDTDTSGIVIRDSKPSSGTTSSNGWQVRWTSNSGGNVDPGIIRTWALCAPAPLS